LVKYGGFSKCGGGENIGFHIAKKIAVGNDVAPLSHHHMSQNGCSSLPNMV
jgi:hypothetical protein